MKLLALSAVVLLSGCAVSPQEMARASDYEVCRMSMGNVNGPAAHQEASRRGVDCRSYYGAILAREQAQNDAVNNYLRSIQPQQQQQRRVYCRSVRVGNQVNTVCD